MCLRKRKIPNYFICNKEKYIFSCIIKFIVLSELSQKLTDLIIIIIINNVIYYLIKKINQNKQFLKV